MSVRSVPRSAGVGNWSAAGRVTVVIITHNRRRHLLHTLERLAALTEQPPVVVVDNGSVDDSAAAVTACHPQVRLLTSARNLGAVGRNVAVERIDTPYVAFCDDDTWWDPGGLERAVTVLDAHPGLGAVTGRILVEPGGAEDPIVAELRDSPLPGPPWLPGPALGSVLAAATVVRVTAFRQVGGFSPRLWLGGEEELLATDLRVRGWWLCYLDDVVVRHRAAERDQRARRRLGLRNTLWYTWLRRPPVAALRRTTQLAFGARRDMTTLAAFGDALRGLPWVLRARRPVPPPVEAGLRLLAEPQRRSRARRY